MPFVFIMMVGIVLGFALAMMFRAWLRACERAEQARLRRQETKQDQ